MQTGSLLSGLKSVPANTGLVEIAAGTYKAGGVNSPVRSVTVERSFFTPPGEVTNAQAEAVIAKYGDRPNGLFFRDRNTGHHYLYKMGKGDDVQTFETIDPRLLPPELGIGDSFDSLLENEELRARLDFDTENVRRIMPRSDRYHGLKYEEAFADPDVAITCISAWQAQALAQLMGDPEIAAQLFGVGGLGGAYYADLLTEEQWGLMAMEGTLEFMTSTGDLLSPEGKELRALHLPYIPRASDYPALSNRIWPNTVLTWMKNIIDQSQFNILRGDSWSSPFVWSGRINNPRHVSFRSSRNPDFEDYYDVGMRVGYFRRNP